MSKPRGEFEKLFRPSVLVEVPTRNREAVLGRHISAMLKQTFQDFDFAIVNDGDREIAYTEFTRFQLDVLGQGRNLWVMDGSHISQAHNHNMILYDPRFRHYKYIIRMDDDIILNPFAFQELHEAIVCTGAAAVGGLWMEDEDLTTIHDRMIFWTQEEFDANPSINGRVGPINSNWAQRVYHPTDGLMEVEHAYSVCIYNAELMRQVGGWPEIYGKGVAHGEETDGTHRLFLAGHKLYVNPRATGTHLRSSGGIRDQTDLAKVQAQDQLRWQNRLPHLAEINFKPKVAIECHHAYGLGGAERLFYHTVHLLQTYSELDVYPIFIGPHLTPTECQASFGFSYEDPEERPEEYDVGLVIGHEPDNTVRARHKIFYCLFPLQSVSTGHLLQFDSIVGISQYTSEWIKEWWRYNTRHIYPSVNPVGRRGEEEKENIILVVGRCVPHKAPEWLLEQFVDFGLAEQGWALHLVAATGVEAYREYEQMCLDYAAKHDGIIVHHNISEGDLQSLYRRARILWAANGLRGSTPQQAEHFGYTPVEAIMAGCVPIVYDRGGHKETVPDGLRWNTIDELQSITQSVIGGDLGHGIGFAAFLPSIYIQAWDDLIRQVNAGCLQLDHVEEIEVQSGRICVGLIGDSPYFPEWGMGVTSGFGQISRMLAQAVMDDEDMDLAVLGLFDAKIPDRGTQLPYYFFPPIGDREGRRCIPEFINRSRPDVLFMHHAPGDALLWVEQLRALDCRIPIVAYFPVEGAGRLNAAIPRLLELVEAPITYCHSGADLIEHVTGVQVDVAYLGLDHSDFKPLPDSEREQLRRMVGWGDKFVCLACATNKRTKNYPVLVDAMRILLERGHDDIYFYFHTKKFDKYILQGWALNVIIEQEEAMSGLPIGQHIMFPADYDKWKGVDYNTAMIDMWRYTRPNQPGMRGAMFNALDLSTRFGLCDLYVDVSSAEGWGLPVLEAAACGVPAISVSDGMVRDEVHSKYCLMLGPSYWDTWHTGTKLAMVDPVDVADTIIALREDDDMRDTLKVLGSTVMEDLLWKPSTDLFLKRIRDAHALPRKA